MDQCSLPQLAFQPFVGRLVPDGHPGLYPLDEGVGKLIAEDFVEVERNILVRQAQGHVLVDNPAR